MPFLLVAASSSTIKSLAELIARAKSQPDALGYAPWGAASAGYLLGELLKRTAGIEAVHVPC